MKKIRIGVFGLNRGYDNFNSILLNDAEIVAVCDKKPELIRRAQEKLGKVAAFASFDEFIAYPMDAVYLANCFPEHTPYAVKALEKNIHVICECLSNGTMAEGVALVRAAEQSKAFFMLAENYPYMLFNREMQRVYQGGSLGKLMFAEGEYNHPVAPDDDAFTRRFYDGVDHWRTHLPATYYVTHSLGPLMMATHACPVRVTAMPIYNDDRNVKRLKYTGDRTAIITCLNDDGSVFRVTGAASFGAHENSYRLACENGQIENVRGTAGKIMLRYSEWMIPAGAEAERFYRPAGNENDEKRAALTGHDGGDYYMFKDFFTCIREGRKPYFDHYTATTMASVAILAHRSLLAFGQPYDIPDFHHEAERKQYENDILTPFVIDGKAPTIPCCSHPDFRPADASVERFCKILAHK